jgi:hypothetical protein
LAGSRIEIDMGVIAGDLVGGTDRQFSPTRIR